LSMPTFLANSDRLMSATPFRFIIFFLTVAVDSGDPNLARHNTDVRTVHWRTLLRLLHGG
jgi:hypothetical protein